MTNLEPLRDQALAPSRPPVVVVGMALPALFAGAGERDAIRVAEFFAAQIRNANTRRAYLRAVTDFSNFCEARGLVDLDQVQPLHVAAWVEIQLKSYSKPTVKQQLAAVRMLFDWLVVGQVVRSNPASSVRGPKHSVKRGKTPVLDAESTRQLLDSIEHDTDIGRRDRALIGLMVYTFARIGAVVQMKVGDYFFQGHRACVRLHEKGGKEHEMPVHHALHDLLEDYLTHAGLKGSDGPLFQSVAGRSGKLTGNPMSQSDAWNMLQRRALAAGLRTKITNHTFRATGITEYLLAGGKVEIAQRMANHESSRTTGLYDRRPDVVALDEIERIRI
jgi:site-specific recombinase XerD